MIKNKKRFISHLLLGVLMAYSMSCASYIKIQVVKTMPKGFMKVMKGGKRIGILTYSKKNYEFEDTAWKQTIQGAVENAFNDWGYFEIVDISSRADRLKQIAHSQTGITSKEKEIGKELAIDGLLYIEVYQKPLYEYKTSTYKKVVRERYKVGKKYKYRDVKKTFTKTTLYYTVFAKGRLVNVETGQTLVYSNTKPIQISREVEGYRAERPSLLKGFHKAAQYAGQNLAYNLSPQMKTMNVVVGSDPIGVPDSVKEQVKSYLEMGNKWALTTPPNLDEAKNSWKEALSISEGTSIYALWNLGVYYWSVGNMEKAQKMFDKVKKYPGFLSGDKMNVYAKFKVEMKRISLEHSASSKDID